MREDDYIRRGDVVRDIEELSFTMSMCVSVDECKGMKSAQKIIASIVAETTPAADVRPVVTCGECIHRHERNRQSCQGRRSDFFCADGEKREES